MKKFNMLLSTIIIMAMTVSGCSLRNNNAIQNVQQVSYICGAGDIDQNDFYLIRSDLHLQHYSFTSEEMDFSDLLSGELPPQSTLVDEKDISQDQWDSLLEVTQENNFMDLTEDLSAGTDTCDGDTYYIEIQTDKETHRSGGYAAGIGEEGNDKRFDNVRKAIENFL